MNHSLNESLNTEQFLNDSNINMLWDIILDENLVTIQNEGDVHKNKLYFINKVHIFYEREKHTNKNLIRLNKEFINSIIPQEKQPQLHLQSQPQPQPQPQFQLRKGNNEYVKAEDIRLDRLSQFEKELEQRKQTFTNSVNVVVPTAPNFKDSLEDIPIADMEDLISKTLAQRNFDIEQINDQVNIDQVNNFLKGKETSLKSEKIQFRESISKQNNTFSYSKENEREKKRQQQSEIKYIKISTEDLSAKPEAIELTPSSSEKKHIKWAEEIDDANRKETNNIFSKLKMIPTGGSLSPLEQNILLTKPNLKKPGEESDFYKQDKYDRLSNKIDLLTQKMDLLIDCILRGKTDLDIGE